MSGRTVLRLISSMCGRIEILTYEEVADVVAAVERRARATVVARERVHARPGSSVLLFGHGAGDASAGEQLEIAEATWGFQADWSKQPLFNTRIESALEGSAMWREPIADGRCVIPAAAFFEPHATETTRSPRTGRPVKRQYRFTMPDDEPLLLAGVQANGRCSVVTCPPNRWVAPIHDRMPLALRFEEVRTWLGDGWPSLSDRADMPLAVAPEHPDSPAQLSLFS